METDLGLGLPELKLSSWGVSCQSRGVSTLSLEVSKQTDHHCGMGCFEAGEGASHVGFDTWWQIVSCPQGIEVKAM